MIETPITSIQFSTYNGLMKEEGTTSTNPKENMRINLVGFRI